MHKLFQRRDTNRILLTPSSARTAALTALAMSAFAANSLLCRAALGAQAVDAVSFTTLRIASGAVVLALAARSAPTPVSRPWALAAALFGYAIAFSLAYTRITAAVGALALFGAVQVTMIGWALLAGHVLSPREWTGLTLAVAGLVGLTLPGLTAPDPLGLALMIAAGACWGAYSLMGRDGASPLAANAASFTRALPLTLAVTALVALFRPVHLTPAGLSLAIASGALASGLGYAVWYAALRGLSATQAAVVQLSVPPLAAVGALAFLQERAGLRLLLCSALILGGIAFALAARRQPRP